MRAALLVSLSMLFGCNETSLTPEVTRTSGEACSSSENTGFSAEKISPVIDAGDGWIAYEQSTWGDVSPFTNAAIHTVQCETGKGLRLAVDASGLEPGFTQEAHNSKISELGEIFASAQAGNRLDEIDYLRQLGSDAGLKTAVAQATSQSKVATCGCALHYSETPLNWDD